MDLDEAGLSHHVSARIEPENAARAANDQQERLVALPKSIN